MCIKSLKFGRNSGPIVGFEGVFTQLAPPYGLDLIQFWVICDVD